MSVATRCVEEVKEQDLDIGVYGSPDQGETRTQVSGTRAPNRTNLSALLAGRDGSDIDPRPR